MRDHGPGNHVLEGCSAAVRVRRENAVQTLVTDHANDPIAVDDLA